MTRTPAARQGPASVTVVLSLPPRELSPNHTVGSRGGRMAKSVKTKAYRQAAHTEAMVALCGRYSPLWPHAVALATFYVKDRRRRDRDNLLASLKAAFDGITDAGIVADDAGLTHQPVRVFVDKVRQRVEIELWPNVMAAPAGGGAEEATNV